MFQFPELASCSYVFTTRYYLRSRFTDSEIPGSKRVSSSPRLIAAAHVLLRLSTPRHPPRALQHLKYLQGTFRKFNIRVEHKNRLYIY